ncbi:bifunctional 23S rRNA (guanine(2069)-N(7))-methyltransferase RlmK/23S rRNA (guanine(2445)-N(2))-methyltransferase RlmL [Methylogaea oryzae]|uniref:Ribosomal RNA large subunit methyltransferase K/L n=3 Tax=Methylogaea oryzae TaxID=1295382 RepID=A0A8D4VRB3_9GAMM|nr:bifunctional 23S rRNA (guanine(2069)-N(7))-methyltransferase RlmK/23S rRNA (guanine(2445)-N(2))-methyltransferase RlmL [Methylogaea oryzae]BBL72277.1 ribosomal RNA large subunit methyltransferase K/L [Methylogaea oryzae]
MLECYASCPSALEGLLEKELRSFGASECRVDHRGVWFKGGQEVAYRACLWSRLASRVVVLIADIPAQNEAELYNGVLDTAWEQHMDVAGTFAVDLSGSSAGLNHSRFAALRVKDAIADRFRRQGGLRPSVDTERPDVMVSAHLHKGRAWLGIDLAGAGLHRRGYREDGGAAPLKENVAAAVLMWAGWPQVAADGGAFVDPMCGSGTLVIEAALMAADIAPGLLRDYFGLLGWRRHDVALWARLRTEAEERRRAGLERMPGIYGYDQERRAVAAASANVQRAGVAKYVHIERRAMADSRRQGDYGLVALNPPYGERLGAEDDLAALYEQLGAVMRGQFEGWRGAVMTGDAELGFRLGIRSEKPRTLFNGPIECRLLTFAIAPERYFTPRDAASDTPARRAVADALRRARQRRESGSTAAEGFANRLRKNLKHLGRWARQSDILCYRVYDADLPEYAVAVDLYQGEDTRWAHVQEYAAPKDIDPAKADERLGDALAAVSEVLEIPADRLYLKVRQKQKGAEQYDKLADSGRFHEVREGPCRLWVNFEDYLDTGLFLDHRITRHMLGELAGGKRFLNLFCYTGSATVHAALGGAIHTTSVDMSRTYLDWAGRNLALNGLVGYQHELVQADCLAWLDQAARAGGAGYDLIFVDPPTFSNSKRMEGVFDVQRDHGVLIDGAMRLLTPGGLLVFSTNRRKFLLDERLSDQYRVEDITRQTIPMDFQRNPRIHVCWKIRR